MTNKEKAVIKRYFKANNAVKPVYYRDSDGYIYLTNAYSIIRITPERADIVEGLTEGDATTGTGKTVIRMITEATNERTGQFDNLALVNAEDLKAFKPYAKKNRAPFVACYGGTNYIGFNPLFVLDAMGLMNKKDKVSLYLHDKKSPFIVKSDDIMAYICPIALAKDYSVADYSKFTALIEELKRNQAEEKERKKVLKAAEPKRNKKLKVQGVPIIVKNHDIMTVDGYLYSDLDMDFLIFKSPITKEYNIYSLNMCLPVARDGYKSIKSAIELLYTEYGGGVRWIDKFYNIVYNQNEDATKTHYNIIVADFNNAGVSLDAIKPYIDKLLTPPIKEETTETTATAADIDKVAPVEVEKVTSVRNEGARHCTN